jgi:tRNA threonylcarbamoyl adenosine modification protein (Sua5/YciO/YrdC/YwlC family)
MKIVTIDAENIDQGIIGEAAQVLKKGGIIAIPTETVYGLAGSCDNKNTVKRLYELKSRPQDKPFSLAVGDAQKGKEVLGVLPPFAYRLIEEFWPGPLTVVSYDAHDKVVGVRVPEHPVARRVLQAFGGGVCLPSANLSGAPEATTAGEVEAAFDSNIDMIIDSGPCKYGKSSTVIDLTFYPFKILRQGAVTEQQIIETFTRKRILFVCTGNTCRSPMAQFLAQIYMNKLSPYASQRYEVISRGISAYPGGSASSGVLQVIREKESIDVKGFASQRLNHDALLSSDLIFTMEDEQYEHILKVEPTVEGRLFHLKKFLPPELEGDIEDPIGQGVDAYRKLYEVMSKAINELIHWL